jgi:hypothetical protein
MNSSDDSFIANDAEKQTVFAQAIPGKPFVRYYAVEVKKKLPSLLCKFCLTNLAAAGK